MHDMPTVRWNCSCSMVVLAERASTALPHALASRLNVRSPASDGWQAFLTAQLVWGVCWCTNPSEGMMLVELQL